MNHGALLKDTIHKEQKSIISCRDFERNDEKSHTSRESNLPQYFFSSIFR